MIFLIHRTVALGHALRKTLKVVVVEATVVFSLASPVVLSIPHFHGLPLRPQSQATVLTDLMETPSMLSVVAILHQVLVGATEAQTTAKTDAVVNFVRIKTRLHQLLLITVDAKPVLLRSSIQLQTDIHARHVWSG